MIQLLVDMFIYLSILCFVALVYQIDMSFVLHFILQRGENIKFKKEVDKKDKSIWTIYTRNVEQIGSDTYVYFDLPDSNKQNAARFNPPRVLEYNQIVNIKMDTTKFHLFDKLTGQSILSPKSLEEEL